MLEWGRLATAWRYLKEWSWVEVSVERIRFSRIAKNLAMLGLWNDGTLVPLNRITNGRGQRADLRKIFGRMQNMEAVTKAGEWLRRARYNQVRARARSRNSDEKATHIAQKLDFGRQLIAAHRVADRWIRFMATGGVAALTY
ncbi:MAG TPA: hypothetical protein VKB29_11310 [Candidatus Binataceae bacterium]|nr:hypothetical protein [Candidatus Binataceae bacterium]